MTNDEIIRMAREAGFELDALGCPCDECKAEQKMLERFAALVAAHEREKQAEHRSDSERMEPVAWWDGKEMFNPLNKSPMKCVTQEPIAWMYEAKFTKQVFLFRNNDILPNHKETPLYAAPVQQAEQEPVAYDLTTREGCTALAIEKGFERRKLHNSDVEYLVCNDTILRSFVRFALAAPVRQVDLTDDEIERALDAAKVPELPDGYKSVDLEIARAVIAADREKNK